MGKYHMKRLAAPKTWAITRKNAKFVTKPISGPHGLEKGIPFSTAMKEILKFASTTREVRKILHANDIKIDGRVVKDFRLPIGIFDTIEFSATNECYRALFNKKGKIEMVKISKEETRLKPCKITGKTAANKKVQLNLYDGRNILVDKDVYKTGDSVLLALPEQKISKHLKLDRKSAIFLTGGKHIGETGNVEDIVGNKIIYKDENGGMVETSKKYAFVVGDSKPLITIKDEHNEKH